VLATGARANVPNIPGLDQQGVYTFRSLKDAEYLYARSWRAQYILVSTRRFGRIHLWPEPIP